VLNETAEKPERAAVHYALLRSLKQATYSPIQDEHYALASTHYCHFTSPIRRYPDLAVHRLLDRIIKHKKASADLAEMVALGEHSSKMERRAETAERELVKVKILTYLSGKLGVNFDAVITGVADYGFFAQAEQSRPRAWFTSRRSSTTTTSTTRWATPSKASAPAAASDSATASASKWPRGHPETHARLPPGGFGATTKAEAAREATIAG